MNSPKSNTERVRAYRSRLKRGSAAIQVNLSPEAAAALKRLSVGSTKSAVINRLLIAEDLNRKADKTSDG